MKSVECKQSGATAIEFAFVFPVLFFLLYSTVMYSLLYFVQQSINFAAQEAARAAVAVDLGQTNAQSAVLSQAQSASVSALASILPSFGSQVTTAPTSTISGSDVVTVTVTFTLNPKLFNAVNIPPIGSIPPMPAVLTAQAVGQL